MVERAVPANRVYFEAQGVINSCSCLLLAQLFWVTARGRATDRRNWGKNTNQTMVSNARIQSWQQRWICWWADILSDPVQIFYQYNCLEWKIISTSKVCGEPHMLFSLSQSGLWNISYSFRTSWYIFLLSLGEWMFSWPIICRSNQ